MAGNIGFQSVPPQYYSPSQQYQQWGQQQPWGGQQQQPWGQQQQPWGQQQQPWGGQMETRGIATSPIAPQEKAVLREVLNILKEGRVALATGVVDVTVAQRLTAAHAYLSGFLEARGQQEMGAYIQTIPPLSTRDSALGDPEFDEALENLELSLSEGAETRFGFGSLIKVAKMAPAIFKVGRQVVRHIRD
jgi:hypothetical protein